jgi:hypothetical protein
MDKARGAYYGMSYGVRKSFAGAMFVVALFDNPEDPHTPLRAETIIEPGTKEVQLQSPSFHAIDNDKRYTVHLMLYSEAEHVHLIGTHDQEVLFSVPTSVVQAILEKYGVTIY